jgi:protein tyrosine/serine phosphatase
MIMLRAFGSFVGVVVVLLLIAAPVAVALHQQKQTRNFRVVREGVLYRSGQMSLEGLQRIIHDYHIKTVINLREGQTPADRAEEEYCQREEINFVRLYPCTWWAPSGPAPVEKNVRQFQAIMRDPRNYPVLIHCFAGIHRTGAYCAIYRMEFDHWDNDRAIAEMRNCGYDHLDDEWDVLGYLEHYRPRQ